MGREIKFRGIRKDNNEWAYGHYTEGSPGWHYITSNNGSILEVHPDTVGQFTGLHDRYGEEIYEGDVVSIPYIDPTGRLTEGENYRREVKFKNGSYIHEGYDIQVLHSLDQWCKRGETRYVSNVGEITEMLDHTYLTLLGSVHKNPVLLNETHPHHPNTIHNVVNRTNPTR